MSDTMQKDFRNDDDAQLAQMGHKAELKRQFSMLYVHLSGLYSKIDLVLMFSRSMLGLAFAILNVSLWSGVLVLSERG